MLIIDTLSQTRLNSRYVRIRPWQGTQSIFAKSYAHARVTVVIGPIIDGIPSRPILDTQRMHGTAGIAANLVYCRVVKPNIACTQNSDR